MPLNILYQASTTSLGSSNTKAQFQGVSCNDEMNWSLLRLFTSRYVIVCWFPFFVERKKILLTMTGRWSDIPEDIVLTLWRRSGWLLQMLSRQDFDTGLVISRTSWDKFRIALTRGCFWSFSVRKKSILKSPKIMISLFNRCAFSNFLSSFIVCRFIWRRTVDARNK